jgi:hypothetical protein
METDRWLIQNIDDPLESRTDLRSEPDPLRLSSGESTSSTGESHILESDSREELKAFDDIFEYRLGDMVFWLGEYEPREEYDGLFDTHARKFANIFPSYFNMEKGFLQSISITRSTDLFGGELSNTLEIGITRTLCFTVSSFEIGDESLISRLVHLAVIALSEIRELKRSWNAIEDFLSILWFQEWPWGIHGDGFFGAYCLEEEGIVGVLLPGEDSSFGDRELTFDDIWLSECRRCSESMTLWTGSMMRVKREIRQSEPDDLSVTVWTIGMERKMRHWRVLTIDRHSTITLLESDTEWICETSIEVRIHLADETIDHDIYWIISDLEICRGICYGVGSISDLISDKSHIRDSFRQLLDSGRLYIESYRHQDVEPLTFAKLRHCFDDLSEAIFFEWDIRMIRTIRRPDTRIEEAIEVVYLRDRPDSRSRIVRHGLLMDGDRRGESLDLTDMSRLRDIWDDSTSIGGEWL